MKQGFHGKQTPLNVAHICICILFFVICDTISRQVKSMEASLHILRELLIKDSMPTEQALNHINYLIQVACLAQTNPWNRVRDYGKSSR